MNQEWATLIDHSVTYMLKVKEENTFRAFRQESSYRQQKVENLFVIQLLPWHIEI